MPRAEGFPSLLHHLNRHPASSPIHHAMELMEFGLDKKAARKGEDKHQPHKIKAETFNHSARV